MMPSDGRTGPVVEAAAGVLEPVFERLVRIAETVAANHLDESSPWSETDLAPVKDLLLQLLTEDQITAGMGFVAAPGAMEGQDRYMMWWQRRGDRVARLRLNFDPTSIDVYDYVQMEWYQLPRSGSDRVAFGPYVDYSGSGLYTVTATVPVRVEGRFVGVVGADLVFTELERRLVSVLRQVPADAIVVSAERRVLAANTARWVVGSKLPAMPRTGEEFASVEEIPVGTGWVLATSAGGVGAEEPRNSSETNS
jgi:hypothetical protein